MRYIIIFSNNNTRDNIYQHWQNSGKERRNWRREQEQEYNYHHLRLVGTSLYNSLCIHFLLAKTKIRSEQWLFISLYKYFTQTKPAYKVTIFSPELWLWSVLSRKKGLISALRITFLYCLLFSRESRTTNSLLETIQKRRKTFPCVRGSNYLLQAVLFSPPFVCLSVARIYQKLLHLLHHRPRTNPLKFGWIWLKIGSTIYKTLSVSFSV